jgi:hypothetical protein
MIGIRRRIIIGGFANPMSQARCSRFRQVSQIEVISSTIQISAALGR